LGGIQRVSILLKYSRKMVRDSFIMLIALLPLLTSLPIPMENVNVLENALGYLEQSTSYRFSGFLGELKQQPLFYQGFEQFSPITIFVPTDDAWSNLPQYFWNSPELQQERYDLILYHCVPRYILFKGISYGEYSNFTTLNGNDILMKRNETGIFVQSGDEVESMVVAQVGIRGVNIFAIDKVLEQPRNLSSYISDLIRIGGNPTNRISVELNRTISTIEGIVNSSRGFTALIPSMNAVSNYTKQCNNGTEPSLLSMSLLLINHLLSEKLYLIHFRGLDNITTVGNTRLHPRFVSRTTQFRAQWNQTHVYNSSVLPNRNNLLASNGVVHFIDRVLVPENFTLECELFNSTLPN
jgi:uncharacterized surface protein with fasciclin (FAS1) repeats